MFFSSWTIWSRFQHIHCPLYDFGVIIYLRFRKYVWSGFQFVHFFVLWYESHSLTVFDQSDFRVAAYDNGDMINIDGQFTYVDKISLLTTRGHFEGVFRMDNHLSAHSQDGRHVVIANHSLLGKNIINYTRSLRYVASFPVYIDVAVIHFLALSC